MSKINEQLFESCLWFLAKYADTFVIEDNGNGLEHLQQSLPGGSIKGLVTGIPQIREVNQPFKSLFGMYASGGFGTGNAFGNADLGGFLADGGSANANTPYVVGERGPELFVPRSSGTVIPNHALAGAGGTTMVTNNYINAIDTKSFEERLYGSSNAIWAANQYANKSLAVNRGRA